MFGSLRPESKGLGKHNENWLDKEITWRENRMEKMKEICVDVGTWHINENTQDLRQKLAPGGSRSIFC